MTRPDVLIVGGGVIGLTTAWHLAADGVRVAVVEAAAFGRQASWAGAGILPAGGPADAPYERLRALASRLFPPLSRDLLQATGVHNGYHVCGGVELPEAGHAEPPSDEWHADGTPHRLVGRADLDRLWPGLHPRYDRAAELPALAQVRNPWHLRALLAGCQARGVSLWADWPASRLLLVGRRVEGVEGERGRLEAGAVLLAAGAWSEALLAQAGHRPGVRPVRGQMALLDVGRPTERRVLLVGKRYLVPRGDGRILVGSTEEEAGFDARPTAGGVAGLLAFAADVVPSLASAVLERSWAGLRPGSADGMPHLGGVPGYDDLHVATGHFRAGLHLSPATGLVMAQHLTGRPTAVPLEAFGLGR